MSERTPEELTAMLRLEIRSLTNSLEEHAANFAGRDLWPKVVADLRRASQGLRYFAERQGEWQPMSTAPKGGFPEGFSGERLTTDPSWVEPPRILASVNGQLVITYWDWYYAEGGKGHKPGWSGWVDIENACSFREAPTHWMPLPAPPRPTQEP